MSSVEGGYVKYKKMYIPICEAIRINKVSDCPPL